MTRDEWINRYATRVQEMAGLEADEAMTVAVVGADEHEQDARAEHEALTWEDPEYAADEEMSCWDDDGE